MPFRHASPKFVTQDGKRLFLDQEFCRDGDRRLAAVDRLIHALPESWPDVFQLIRERRHRYSGEVQFILFNFIPWDPPPAARVKLLREVDAYLMNVPTDAGRSAWLCGDTLAHWSQERDHGELAILLNRLHSARFAAGRLGALHGLQHKLNYSGAKDSRRILESIWLAVSSDRSRRVRDKARSILEGPGGCCWNRDRLNPGVARYLRKIQRRIRRGATINEKLRLGR